MNHKPQVMIVRSTAAGMLLIALGGCSSVAIAPHYEAGDSGTVVASIMAPQRMAQRYYVRLEEVGPDGTRVADAGTFTFVNDGSTWSQRPDFSDSGLLGVVLVGRMKPGTYRIASFDRNNTPAVRCTPSDQGSMLIRVERNAVTYLGRFRHESSDAANGSVIGLVVNDAEMDMRLAQRKSGPLPRKVINAASSAQSPMTCKAR